MLSVFGSDDEAYRAEKNAMFRARAQVFGERLKWDVNVECGLERDRYDECEPLYIVSRDPSTGASRGSLRLLPTSGPHMMRDVFSDFFRDLPLIESPFIWECTRFCIHPRWEGLAARSGVSQVTSELLLGICETAMKSGVELITGVFDHRMTRIYRHAGWVPEIIGSSGGQGHGAIHVGLWEVSERVSASIRRRSGIHWDVFARPGREGCETIAA